MKNTNTWRNLNRWRMNLFLKDKEKLIKYEEIDGDIAETAENVLEIAARAGEMFSCSKPDVKNQILKLLVSNTTIEGEKAWISLQKPFDLLLKNPNCLLWSGRHDLNMRLSAPKADTLPG